MKWLIPLPTFLIQFSTLLEHHFSIIAFCTPSLFTLLDLNLWTGSALPMPPKLFSTTTPLSLTFPSSSNFPASLTPQLAGICLQPPGVCCGFALKRSLTTSYDQIEWLPLIPNLREIPTTHDSPGCPPPWPPHPPLVCFILVLFTARSLFSAIACLINVDIPHNLTFCHLLIKSHPLKVLN